MSIHGQPEEQESAQPESQPSGPAYPAGPGVPGGPSQSYQPGPTIGYALGSQPGYGQAGEPGQPGQPAGGPDRPGDYATSVGGYSLAGNPGGR